MKYPSFLESEFDDAAEQALFQFIPVPLERSVSFGRGTAQGPLKLLQASSQLEIFDGFDIPGIRGLATQEAHPCSGSIEEILESLAQRLHTIWEKQQCPILLGGEHTLSIAAFWALQKYWGVTANQKVGIIQIDAHADLRQSYQNNRYSHACVMNHALELGFRIHQLGVRSLSPFEQDLRLASDALSYQEAWEINKTGKLKLPADFPEQVYLSVDVDGLDPSIIPGTGTPEPGGIQWYPCLKVLQQLSKTRRIVGFDIVELAPEENRWLSEFSSARLCYQILGLIARKQENS